LVLLINPERNPRKKWLIIVAGEGINRGPPHIRTWGFVPGERNLRGVEMKLLHPTLFALPQTSPHSRLPTTKVAAIGWELHN
jgi:hypothetical protein